MLAKGKGSVYELRPGVYQFRFNLGKDPVTGKYRYSPKKTLHCEAKNKRGREAELRAAMEQYRMELQCGAAITAANRFTVSSYAEHFHQLRINAMGSRLSYKREATEISHIKALFGEAKLADLTTMSIKNIYAKSQEDESLSQNGLYKINVKLSQILDEAVADGLITKNPCKSISIPRPKGKERRSLSTEEAKLLYSKLHKSELSAKTVGTLLLLDSGMRRGEMLGLLWKNVDLDRKTAHIIYQYAADKELRSPKSSAGNRTIHLSSQMTETLKQWKTEQRAHLDSIVVWQTGNTPIVSNEYGSFLDPNNYGRWFRQWCVDNGFGEYEGKEEKYIDSQGRRRTRKRNYRGLTPHMLRHTQATLLLAENTDLKTVQSRLGHFDSSLTLGVYSHAVISRDEEAANTIGNLVSN